jgi:hypothetical protein
MSLSNLTGPPFLVHPDLSASNGELEVRLPPPRFTGPRVRHRERGDAPGSFGQSGEAQRRNHRIEVFLMAIGQTLRPATGGQVRVVG